MHTAYWLDNPALLAAFFVAVAAAAYQAVAKYRSLRDELDLCERRRGAAMERLSAAHFLANATKEHCLGNSHAALRCVCALSLICDPAEVEEDAARIPESVRCYVRDVAVSAVESARRYADSSRPSPYIPKQQ